MNDVDLRIVTYTVVLSKPGEGFCYTRRTVCDACAPTLPNRSLLSSVINGICEVCWASNVDLAAWAATPASPRKLADEAKATMMTIAQTRRELRALARTIEEEMRLACVQRLFKRAVYRWVRRLKALEHTSLRQAA